MRKLYYLSSVSGLPREYLYAKNQFIFMFRMFEMMSTIKLTTDSSKLFILLR